MRFKTIVILLILFNWLKISAMADVGEKINSAKVWNDLPEELALYVISFAAKGDTISQTIKRLADLGVDKRSLRLCKDIRLKKALFILHLDDADYQNVLNKMLFKSACCGNLDIIEILSVVPAASKSKQKNSAVEVLDDSDESGEPELEVGGTEMSFIEANVNNIGVLGYTPLLHASERGYKKLVQLLLNYGAVVVVKNGDNDTALVLASKKGHIKIVKKLLFFEDARIYINLKGFGGDNAFLCAVKRCIYASEKDIEDNYLDIVKLLADHGADVNCSDAADLTAMDWAVKEGKVRLITVLIDLKAHLTKKNKARFEVYLLGRAVSFEDRELLEKIKALEENTEVIAVKFQLKHQPYWLSFYINDLEYLTKVGDKLLQVKFAEEISKLDFRILVNVGEKIVEEVLSKGFEPGLIVNNCSSDSNDYRLAFQLIFGHILYNPYSLAKRANLPYTSQALINIRELVKPLFKAFPEKGSSMYTHNLNKFDIVT